MRAPLSYPLPLLSITTYLALLSARIPRLISQGDEDPMFDDDWEASTYLYPFISSSTRRVEYPTITLLIAVLENNLLFDPSSEELAVAQAVVAVSISLQNPGEEATKQHQQQNLNIISIRTIDPPSRLTPQGIPNSVNVATGAAPITADQMIAARESMTDPGVWGPPRGGLKRSLVAKITKAVLGEVAMEVMAGLNTVAA